MSKARRISIFHKDGTPLYDQVYKDRTKGHSASYQTLGADRLWPLIQVFVQFSREVQGGDVKRLVFRGPKAYAQTHNQFEALPLPARPTPVTIVYLVHSERFVVTVTEQLIGDTTTAASLLASSASSTSSSIPEFCNSLLSFLNKMRSEPEILQDHTNEPHESGTPARISSSLSSLSNSDDSRIRLPVNLNQSEILPSPSVPPPVLVEAAKVTAFIAEHLT